MSQTAMLLCEGRCNPRMKLIDGRIHRYGQDLTRAGVYDGCRYQPHVHLFGGFWACEECGASRRWGNFVEAGDLDQVIEIDG